MAAIFDFSSKTILAGLAGTKTGQIATDGTYLWFVTQENSTRKLWRLRHSDKELITPSGIVGNTTNAYITLPNTYTSGWGLATDGTNVLVCDEYGAQIYRNSDMGYVGQTGGSLQGVGGGRTALSFVYANGYFWAPGKNAANGKGALHRITPGTWACSLVFQSTTTCNYTSVAYGGGAFFLSSDSAVPIEKVDGTTLASAGFSGDPSGYTFGSGGAISYDGIRGELWAPLGDGECIRIRPSDMAYLDPYGNANTFVASKIRSGTAGSFMTGSYAVYAASDGSLWSSGVNSTSKSLQRRWTDPARMSFLPVCGGWNNVLPMNLVPYVEVGKTIYFAMSGAAASNGSGVAWCDFDSALVTPNLTNIAITTGPIVSLTFNNSVSIDGPTIGPGASGLGVSGTTQVTPAQIDLICTVVPPNLTQVTPNNAGFGVELTFNSDIAASSPVLDPPLNGLEVTSATAPNTTHIQLDLQFPTLVSTTLVSIVAAAGTITLTFNKAVALSSAGQQPSSYVITTVTPGAVIPTITSVEVGGNQVVLHTTEQTTGADYTVTVAPGSIYGTN